jgi:hypothetical protein
MASNDLIVQYVFTGLLGAGAVGLLLSGFKSLRRKRLVENVPTSKVAGVFLGLTELKGVAEDDDPLESYLTERECVWYAFEVEEEWRRTETYTDSKGNVKTRTESGWTTVKQADVRDPFFLRDDTGRVRVVPDEAEIEGETALSRICGTGDPLYYGKGPASAIAHSTHRRRFGERLIAPRASLYVLGTARLREDVVEPEIAADDEEEMFLISIRSEEAILRSYGLWTPVKLMAGALFLNGAGFLGLHVKSDPDLGATLARAWPVMVGASLAYAAAIFVYYLALLYNGLVSVRNRAAMAWSQIDIQLKRRFDLIPNLVACVKGYVQHEKNVMESLVKIRVEGLAGGGAGRLPSGGAALAISGFADAQTRALSGLFGIVERYPEIKADKGFAKLQQELSTTETKIALARSFYNESVTALNNRIETVPDALIAKPGGFKTLDYFKIEDIEKRPVAITADAFENKESS